MFQCEHDTSISKQTAGSCASSKQSERRKPAGPQSTPSRKLSPQASVKPATSRLTSPNVHPSSLEFQNSFVANTSCVETPAHSTEMMAIDPSSLSLEPSFEDEGIFDGGFDLSLDFDLSPFLQNTLDPGLETLPTFSTSFQASIQEEDGYLIPPIQQTFQPYQFSVETGNVKSSFYGIWDFPYPESASQVAQRSLLQLADDSANHTNRRLQTPQALQSSISTARHDPSLERTNEFFTQCDHHHPTTRTRRQLISVTSSAEATSILSGRYTPLHCSEKWTNGCGNAVETWRTSQAPQGAETLANQYCNREDTTQVMSCDTQETGSITSDVGFRIGDFGFGNDQELLLKRKPLRPERTEVASVSSYMGNRHETHIPKTYGWQIYSIGAHFQETGPWPDDASSRLDYTQRDSPLSTDKLQLRPPVGWRHSLEGNECNRQVNTTSTYPSTLLPARLIILVYLARCIWSCMVGQQPKLAFALLLSYVQSDWLF